MLLAYHITTTATLGNTIVSFEENPDAATEIRADPSLLPAAIEEVLRYRTPFPRLARLATTNARVGEVEIPAQGVILVWLTAANRDARVFPDPNRFDIHRKPNPHLTFGHGIHFTRRCAAGPTGSQGRTEDHPRTATAALPWPLTRRSSTATRG